MFFGQKKDKTASPETTKNVLGSANIGSSVLNPMQQGTEIFSSIHKILLDAIEDEKLYNQKKKNYKEEDNSEDNKKNEALVKAITARRKAKPKKEKVKTKTEKTVTKEEPKAETPKVTTPTPPAKTTTPAPKVETPKVTTPTPPAPKVETPKVTKEVTPSVPAKTTPKEIPKEVTPAPVAPVAKPTPKETTPPSVKPVEAKPNAPISEKVSTATKAIKTSGSLSSVTKLQNSNVDISPDKINPELQKRVSAMAVDFKEKTGQTIQINSGFRDTEKQKVLYEAEMARDPKSTGVARPGTSLHEKGLAFDIQSQGIDGINRLAGPRTASKGWLESFGLIRPVGPDVNPKMTKSEDWHVQLSNSKPSPDIGLNVDKSGAAVDVSTGKTITSGNDIDNISKENAKLKESTKEIKKKTTNNNTEINETTNTNSASGSSDKNPYIQKSQGKDKNLADASPYLVKAQS